MSGVGGQDKPARESQVRTAQVQLEEEIVRAEKAVECLFARIKTVLVQVPPAEEKGAEVAEPCSVQLAGWIHDKARRIRCLGKSIEEMRERVEL